MAEMRFGHSSDMSDECPYYQLNSEPRADRREHESRLRSSEQDRSGICSTGRISVVRYFPEQISGVMSAIG